MLRGMAMNMVNAAIGFAFLGAIALCVLKDSLKE